MLILSRRVGESVVINGEIICTVLGFKGNQVSLGFDAPEDVVIHREEIFKKIQEEQIERIKEQAA
ncbi:carbon storage regulator CsrA [Legionella longbeachae]|uniref:carbon storage regulator CsrA n=1 Tax=Legionella longbeachae TaxID=450 RepID=UPI000A1C1048|nr:carbon storage regulator CsrA [Legionella longbeachae]ARM32548.1 carbon storage regulator CsrA [Legionella longbeachae]